MVTWRLLTDLRAVYDRICKSTEYKEMKDTPRKLKKIKEILTKITMERLECYKSKRRVVSAHRNKKID